MFVGASAVVSFLSVSFVYLAIGLSVCAPGIADEPVDVRCALRSHYAKRTHPLPLFIYIMNVKHVLRAVGLLLVLTTRLSSCFLQCCAFHNRPEI